MHDFWMIALYGALVLGVLFTTVLVSAAALLLDTGSLFTQFGEVQSVAELAALSGISKKMDGTQSVITAAQNTIQDNLGDLYRRSYSCGKAVGHDVYSL